MGYKHDDRCLDVAADDEPIFVLLARDPAATVAIDHWIAERIALGKNESGDAQLIDAYQHAERMRQWRAKNR